VRNLLHANVVNVELVPGPDDLEAFLVDGVELRAAGKHLPHDGFLAGADEEKIRLKKTATKRMERRKMRMK
jgi:hypothetical protein